MPEAAYSPEGEPGYDEAQRARDRFINILDVHGAAIVAFEVLPASPSIEEQISAGLRLRRGMKPENPHSPTIEQASDMLKIMEAERGRGHEVIRSSALVAACGAFEYLIKATFVSQASMQPDEAAKLLDGTKIKLLASDVLGMPKMEQWYAIADVLFDQMPHRQMHERVKQFLAQYVYMPERSEPVAKLEEAFAAIDAHRLDEAFLLRNCVVHNGGRVSKALARHTNRGVGQRIIFGNGVLAPLLSPMKKLADWMHSLYSGFL